jgi:hypothetical protein
MHDASVQVSVRSHIHNITKSSDKTNKNVKYFTSIEFATITIKKYNEMRQLSPQSSV